MPRSGSVNPLQRLQRLSERALTTRILVPLLRELGFDHVEDRHGAHEKGIDVLCVRRDALGDAELIGIQVKKLVFSGRIDSSANPYSVLPQLEQALTERVLMANGEQRLLTKAWLVTPFAIPDGVLDRAFEKYAANVRRGVRVVPGPELLGLIKKNAPHLLAQLGDKSSEYLHRMQREVLVSREAAVLGLSGDRKDLWFRVDPVLAVSFPLTGALLDGHFRPKAARTIRVEQEDVARWEGFGNEVATISKGSVAIKATDRSTGHRNVEVNGERLVADFRARCTALVAHLRTAREKDAEGAPRVIAELFRYRGAGEKVLSRREADHLLVRASGALGDHASIDVTPRELLDAGLSFQVVGDAGMGKTTLLRELCLRTASIGQRLPVFVPLAQMAQRHTLFGMLSSSLSALGYKHSRSSLQDILMSGGALIAFDGIDEAASRVSSLPEQLAEFMQTFGSTQVVVSSRPWAALRESSTGATVIIQPLNEAQLRLFYKRWFTDSPGTADEILTHIAKHPELRRPISTPLVAALLAVVRSRGGRLPTSLPDVYERRLDLFLSDWDNAKGVARDRFDARDKRVFLRKLAFRLHDERVKAAPRAVVERFVCDALGRIDSADATEFVNELVRHNNVLFEEPGDTISFGHLQYQEHLAAQEFRENRMISVTRRLGDAWWNAVLDIYAQLTTDIAALIAAVVKRGTLERHKIQLGRLLGFAPNTDVGLRRVVERVLEQDEAVLESFSAVPVEWIVRAPRTPSRRRSAAGRNQVAKGGAPRRAR